MVAVAAKVQHHPGRARLIPNLLALLTPLDAEVVSDPLPRLRSPWNTYRECLARPLPDGTTHVLVIQDDAVPCRNFAAALSLVARDHPVVLWLGGQPIRSAHAARKTAAAGGRWSPIHPSDWMPAVAILWPVALIGPMLEWVDENPRKCGRQPPRADDAVLGAWKRHTQTPVMATVPSLVEHPDREPSLIGRKAAAGRNRGRVAGIYIGDADPLEIDWSGHP